MKKIASMNKNEILSTLRKVAMLQTNLISKLVHATAVAPAERGVAYYAARDAADARLKAANPAYDAARAAATAARVAYNDASRFAYYDAPDDDLADALASLDVARTAYYAARDAADAARVALDDAIEVAARY